jgi:GTP:adenosylcobinamide-phosphate guanylyltransferase
MSAAGDLTFAALVLGGSRPGVVDPLAAARAVSHKCLLPVAGIPMLDRVVGALSASDRIGAIVLLLDPAMPLDALPATSAALARGRACVVPTAPSPSLSVLAGVERLDRFPVLVTTADHPLLDPAIIERFCAAATGSDAAILIGVAPAAALLASYPESRRTFWRFRDGCFSGANLFGLMRPDALPAVRFWREVEAERKRPWRIARRFGLWPLLAYLSGRLSLADALALAGRTAGARAAPVVLPIAEAAIDVDKPADLELVERILAARERAAPAA